MNTELSENNVALIGQSNCHLEYDRDSVELGIVHFGPGAFHRAHQAVYTDDLLVKGAKEWGICEVSINSATVRDKLLPQDNLYTLAILDREVSHRVIGAIKEVLVAPEDPALVIQRLTLPEIKAVTLTVTEKGYCLTAEGGLDFENHSIVHDLQNVDNPCSVIGFIYAGLKERYKQGLTPFVVISCDNVSDNGKRLKRAVLDFAQTIDPSFVQWLESEVHFPCTMVDSITPATDEKLYQNIEQLTGFKDNWPIQRESFSQWVIEDIPNVTLPPWQSVGAIVTKDVSGYELTKLRVLNCLHSTLAFLGHFAGLETVEQAITHSGIKAFIEKMLHDEIIPTLPDVEGLNKVHYGEKIIHRFENPAIRHLLAQIAWDSSQKIPYRILTIVTDNIANNKTSPMLCLSIAAWIKFVVTQVSAGKQVVDPLEGKLMAITKDCNGSDFDIEQFISLGQVFPKQLQNNKQFIDDIKKAYQMFNQHQTHEISNILTSMRAV